MSGQAPTPSDGACLYNYLIYLHFDRVPRSVNVSDRADVGEAFQCC